MAYFIFKRFGEVDPAKAHAKLTHQRLATLPIPTIDPRKPAEARAHNRIHACAQRLLGGASPVGGEDDLQVETLLRQLWGVTPEDGAYINGEFFDLPDSQILRELFPNGRPRPDRQALT